MVLRKNTWRTDRRNRRYRAELGAGPRPARPRPWRCPERPATYRIAANPAAMGSDREAGSNGILDVHRHTGAKRCDLARLRCAPPRTLQREYRSGRSWTG